MNNRKKFFESLNSLGQSRLEQSIALLWFYRQTQTFDERSASELGDDLQEEGYGKPNVTRLEEDLRKSKFTVKGKRKKTFQINSKYLSELDSIYEPSLNIKKLKIPNNIIQADLVKGTRKYLEELVLEINGTYEFGFYNSTAVLIRRLMESLIIEIYIYKNLIAEIQNGNSFLMLDNLITKITNSTSIKLSRNAPKTMKLIKELGDTAAHDRTYLTKIEDIQDNILSIRRLIQELLSLANIISK